MVRAVRVVLAESVLRGSKAIAAAVVVQAARVAHVTQKVQKAQNSPWE